MYAYINAFGRKHGDRARLVSPKMQGSKCLSIMYHMYGSSMGSLIIYLKTNDNETVEWIKAGNHPDQWKKAAVFVNSSAEYQVTYHSGTDSFNISFQVIIQKRARVFH